jgi:S1-C subfamily serine protease
MSCGFPYGQKRLYCSTIKPKAKEFFNLIADGDIFPGMSGGPVIDILTGEVVGVNSKVYEDGTIHVASLIGLPAQFMVEP